MHQRVLVAALLDEAVSLCDRAVRQMEEDERRGHPTCRDRGKDDDPERTGRIEQGLVHTEDKEDGEERANGSERHEIEYSAGDGVELLSLRLCRRRQDRNPIDVTEYLRRRL